MWRWRNCLVFYSHRAAQETATDTLTGGTKNHSPLPHALIAWSLLIHWVATFLSPLPLQPGDSTTPTGALLRGGPRIYSSLHSLHSIRAPRCAGLWLYCLHSLVLSSQYCSTKKKCPKAWVSQGPQALFCGPVPVTLRKSFKWTFMAPQYIWNRNEKVSSWKHATMRTTLFTWINVSSFLLYRNKAVYDLKCLEDWSLNCHSGWYFNNMF